MAVAPPDLPWFDPENPGQMHDWLRSDPLRTQSAIRQRPSLRRHAADCVICQAAGVAVGEAPNPITTRKRLKLVLNKDQLHQLLHLPENFEIIHAFAENDPNIVTILVAGEGLPMVSATDETPVGTLEALDDYTPIPGS